MNLFNYLMAKKGHNTSVRDDLLAYLLGKRTPKEVKTVTGTTISITDATREKIVSLTLSKESTQDGTPTPENPVEVKTVKGNVGITITDGTNTRNYTIPLGNNEICGIGNYKDELIVDENGKCWLNKKTGKVVLDGSENWQSTGSAYAEGIRFHQFAISVNDKKNGYFDLLCNRFVNVSPAKPNKIVGSNDNKRMFINIADSYLNDDLTVSGFKAWLSTHNTDVYYPLATPQLIDLNYIVDLTLFKGVNNISNSDDMNMTLEYY